MGERKVLNKYYSPDFNPDKIRRGKKRHGKLMAVTNMLPMTLRCNTCQDYLGIGSKFNMRRERCKETYLGIRLDRFYFKCKFCYATICFRTDPKNSDYVVESGATRTYEAWRDAEEAEKVLKEQRETEEQENSMVALEHKTFNSKREMENVEELEDIKQLNKRRSQVTHDKLLELAIAKPGVEQLTEEVLLKEKFNEARSKLLEQEEEAKIQKFNFNAQNSSENKPVSASLNDSFPVPSLPSQTKKMPVLTVKKVKPNEPIKPLVTVNKPAAKATISLGGYDDDE